MVTHKLNRLPKSTVEMIVDIPKDIISTSYDEAFKKLQENLEIEGFRKGKVPKEIAEKHLKKDSVYQELIRMILPKIYDDIVKKEGLHPVISPKIELVKAKEGEDWQIKIQVAERPVVTLGDYKKLIKEAKQNVKKGDIWTPGKDKGTQTDEEKTKQNQELLNAVLDELLKKSKIEISELILEEELNGRLSRLVDDVEKLGMTVETYLKSKNTTIEELRKQYLSEIENIHKMEFLLNEIAEQEKIQVENAELEKLFASIKDEKEKALAHQNAYFYAALLRKQKTLDFLLDL